MRSTRFRIPLALSSVLAVLGTLQLRAVGILNRVDPLVSPSNYYIVIMTCTNKTQAEQHVDVVAISDTITLKLSHLHGFPVCVLFLKTLIITC